MAQCAIGQFDRVLRNRGYEQVKKIGEGAFGTAVLAQNIANSSRVVVKLVDVSKASKRERDEALQESLLLSALQHPSVVAYQTNFLEDGWIGIVMSYCGGGDLSKYIKQAHQFHAGIPERQVVIWLTQAVLGLQYIHELHVLHRDLKSTNLFLTEDGDLKIGDFGIAKVMECTMACAQTQIGTPYYLCPEICQGKPYAWGSDIWAMGCILFEMCSGRVPFQGHDLKSLLTQIIKAAIPCIPAHFSKDLQTICRQMLNRSPNERPRAEDLLKMEPVMERARKISLREERRLLLAREGRHSPVSADSDSLGGENLRRGELVQYWSETHTEWVEAEVLDIDARGRIILNVKPNTWLSHEIQSARVRPRQLSEATSPPLRGHACDNGVAEAASHSMAAPDEYVKRRVSRTGERATPRATPRDAQPKTRSTSAAQNIPPREPARRSHCVPTRKPNHTPMVTVY